MSIFRLLNLRGLSFVSRQLRERVKRVIYWAQVTSVTHKLSLLTNN